MKLMSQLSIRRVSVLWFVVTAIFIVTFVLLPYGWLAERWETADFIVNKIFASQEAHLLGHTLLFGLAGLLLLTAVPRLEAHPLIYIGIIILLGSGQEILQLLSFKQRPFIFGDLFDVVVDVGAAVLVFMLATRPK